MNGVGVLEWVRAHQLAVVDGVQVRVVQQVNERLDTDNVARKVAQQLLGSVVQQSASV